MNPWTWGPATWNHAIALPWFGHLLVFAVFVATIVTLVRDGSRAKLAPKVPPAGPIARHSLPVDPVPLGDLGGIIGVGAPDFGPPPPAAPLEPEAHVERVDARPEGAADRG